jgi:uncharacterized protein (TIGR03663 family)
MLVIASDDVLEFDQTGMRIAIRLTRLEIGLIIVLIGGVTVVAGLSVYYVLNHFMPFHRSRSDLPGFLPSPVCTDKWPELDLILVIGSFTLPFLSHIVISGLSRVVSQTFFGIDAAFSSLDYSEAGLLRSTGFVFILLAVSIAVGVWWHWRRWLVTASVFFTVFVVLFTTVFTNGNGLASGMVGSLGYWLEQQAVERGSQPFYYYGLMVSLYEYLPLIGVVAAVLYVLVRRPISQILSKSWFPHKISPPSFVPHSPGLFLFFLLFWAFSSWPIYSIAGERMPWMTVHLVVPMILISGWVIGKGIEGIDWRHIIQRAGWVVAVVAPLGFAALIQTVSTWLGLPAAFRPFSGYGIGQLNTTLNFLSAFSILLLALGVLYWAHRQLGATAFARVLIAVTLGVLTVLTIRTAWAFAYINYDSASEFLVYAHGSPDVRVVMQQVEEISQRTAGDRSIDVGFTADGSYPLMWYLRNYPNAVRLPNPPSRADLDKSIIIAGDAEWNGIEPYLGNNYTCHPFNFMWWPMQDYNNLNWQRIYYAVVNPEMRGAVWDIVFRRDYRKYEQVTGKTIRPSAWPLRDGLRLCIRRDLRAQVGTEYSGPLVSMVPPRDDGSSPLSYADLEQSADADLEVQVLGTFGKLNNPHGMAFSDAGFLYVADTDNHRIVKLSARGDVVDTWDSAWWKGGSSWTANGCLDETGQALALSDGEFCEPWGVAVGLDGRVYVADTWNHRVQAFSSEGVFLNKVGTFGLSGGSISSAPTQFYGPRDLVVDQLGRIYVSDTGNKRIQVFDADLNYLYSFGGPGIVEGRLDEPVGLTIGSDDLLYVADTWNRRVQVFTLTGDFVRAWPVIGWESQSAVNKPYIFVDSTDRVYLSDPEGSRLIVFDRLGVPQAVFRGSENSYLGLPAGVVLDPVGQLWVSDAANHRLLRFPPLQFADQKGSE